MKKTVIIILCLLSIVSKITSQEIENGYHKFYYPNKKISSEGNFKNGKPDGYWKNYYVTGILKSEGKRRNSLLDSTWVFYDETGDTLSKISYVNGEKNGYYLKYEKNINERKNYIVSKELFFNNKLEGNAFYFFNDGKIKRMCFYRNGKKEGKEYLYNKSGIIITVNNYVKGRITEIEKINRYDDKKRKDGLWREYYKNYRIKKEINYKNGILDGIYKEFDENGNLKISLYYEKGKLQVGKNPEATEIELKNEYYNNGNIKYSGAYKEKKPIGVHRYFNEKGKVIKSEEYDNDGNLIGKGVVDMEGYRQDEWTNYYISGEEKSKGTYINGKKDGQWEYFLKNGKVEQKGSYKNDKYSGKWLWYYQNGKVQKEENFYQGKNDGLYVEYDELGNEISKGEYIEGEKDGEWIFNIGDITEKGKYAVGLKDGKWKSIYINGNLRFEGNYIQGNEDGKHYFYYDNGVIEEERYYNVGYREKVWKKYDKNGNLKMTITYNKNKEIKINGIKIEEIKKEEKNI